MAQQEGTPPLVFYLTRKEWLTLRDGMADIACWHRGYKEAKPDYCAPPQLQEAVNIVGDMKRQVTKEAIE